MESIFGFLNEKHWLDVATKNHGQLMKQSIWEERYSRDEFIYGTQPNEFLASEIQKLHQGKLLLPCEGEGRNAVFAAQLGWGVDAFDYAEAGKTKSLHLASEHDASINYWVSSVEAFEAPANRYDAIALIYCHVAPESRNEFHQKMVQALKPNGLLILEGFSEEQLDFDSGGPPVIERLFTVEGLKEDFQELDLLKGDRELVQLEEGRFHNGLGSVVRLVGKKH